MAVNQALAKAKGLNSNEILAIEQLHADIDDLFKKVKKEKNIEKLPLYAEKLELIEFALQKAWRFNEDASFHTWRFKIPRCTCLQDDKLVKKEKDCPVHSPAGKKSKNSKILNQYKKQFVDIGD